MRAFILAFLLSAAVHAQDRFQVSQTEWGDPDLTGTWLTANTVGLPFQRPADAGDDSLLRELVNAGAVEFGLINEGVPAAPQEAERRWAVTEWRSTSQTAGPWNSGSLLRLSRRQRQRDTDEPAPLRHILSAARAAEATR